MWSTREFSSGLSDFHHMNKDSLSRASYLIGKNAGKSFSRILGNSFRQTVASIFSKKEMTTSKMLEGHISSTVERCKATESERVIVAQDTTYYNYSGQKKMEGLGTIQGRTKGTLQHNALAVTEKGIPLGMIYQRNWTRGGANAFETESEKWFEGLLATNKYLGEIDKSVVLVQDREADIFDFFKAPRAKNVDLLVRVFQKRNLEVLPDKAIAHLHEAIKELPQLGTHQTLIRRNNKNVHLTLSVQASPVNVLPRKDLSVRLHKTSGLSVVVATEVAALDDKGRNCYDPDSAAQWILLTSLDASTFEQACRIIEHYAARWIVERLHYTLKSGGLKVERLQFDDVLTIFNALAMYTIVAWRILYLTLSVREKPDQKPDQYFSKLELKVLSSKHKKAGHSLKDAMRGLGNLVNFVPTTAQPLPGIKIMAEAIRKLNDITEALKDIYEDPLQD
jgi:hypothetical protein